MEPMSICLRQAVLADGVTIHACFGATEPWEQFQTRYSHWMHQQEQNRLFYLLLEQDEQLVGQGQLHFWPRYRAEIAYVAVAAAYRRQGFGTILLNRLIQEAQARSCRQLELCVTTENHPAQALYRQLGFTVSHGFRTPSGEPALVMETSFAPVAKTLFTGV